MFHDILYLTVKQTGFHVRDISQDKAVKEAEQNFKLAKCLRCMKIVLDFVAVAIALAIWYNMQREPQN